MSRKIPAIPAATIAAQATASTPGISAWVSANAGSGKTHVLASRVIRLLLQGADPSRILCLTYTRAAAANMADRVFRTLAGWTMLPEPELVEKIAALDGKAPGADRLILARQLFARALETPGGLKIQTIHAFCEAVLHQFPLEANIAGHFEMLDSRMEAALIAEARREMIASAGGGNPALAEAFASVLDVGGDAGLDALLAAIVVQRDALKAFIAEIGDPHHQFVPLFEEFGFRGSETVADLIAPVWPDPYFAAPLAQAMQARALAAGKKTAADFADGLGAILAEQDPATRISMLRDLFLTKKGRAWSPKSIKNVMAKGVGEFFPEFPEEFARMAAAVEATGDRLALLSMLKGTRAALTVADWLIARYERLKSARGFLDFNDLITRTSALLSRQDAGAWVQYKLDKGIDHILIDEAQDTSPQQWAVVRALASEFFAGHGARGRSSRTIFAVGDEKQSIYSFQGARPEAFRASGWEFRNQVRAAEGTFENVRLDHSFRSTEDVLTAVDIVFAHADNKVGLTRDPEPIEHKAIRAGAPGLVELWPSLGHEVVEEPDDWATPIDHASAPAVRLARDIARTIANWLASGEMIEGQGRRLVPGDVLVLVRKRDRFIHALGRELKDLRIPVAGADRLLLTDHIAVKDLMAIARVALQPNDDLSLAALLKSPAFGFGEERLFDVAAGRPREQSLLRALAVAAETREDARTAWEALSRWRNEAGFSSPFAFFSNILGRDGLRCSFAARLGPEAGEVVDEFLNFCLAAEKTGVTELESLIALLDTGGPVVKREMDQTRGEVRIMTAHAAKGLEAPVVFLVDGGAAPHQESHLPRLMSFDAPEKGWQGKGFLWRARSDQANSFSDALIRQEQGAAEEEYRRLLYVGMTRAEDRLIVCGYHGKSGQKDATWHAMVRDALSVAPETSEVVHPATGAAILRYRVDESRPATEAEPAPVRAVEQPSPAPAALHAIVAMPPALPRPLAPSAAIAMIEPSAHEPPPISSPVFDAELAPALALSRGIALHRLLQVLPDLAPSGWEAAALRYLDRAGRNWPEEERHRVWHSVETVLSDAGFAPLFAPGSRAEVAIAGNLMIGGVERAISGKIDRLAVTGDTVLIADFKTSRPAPSGLDAVPESHVAQMALYRALLGPLYPGYRVMAALVYTDTPLLVQLPAEKMDAVLARLGSA